MMTTIRAASGCSSSALRSPPPLRALRRLFFCRRRPPGPPPNAVAAARLRARSAAAAALRCERSYCVHSLVEGVIEEIKESRRRRLACSASKMALTGSGELLQDKLVNRALEKGLLLEFKKDSEKVLLAVTQRPDGKKNWMVSDQVLLDTTKAHRMVSHRRSSHSRLLLSFPVLKILTRKKFQIFYRGLKITWLVPLVYSKQGHVFVLASKFLLGFMQDPTLLEFAWVELLEKNKSVTAEELAEMIFGSSEPLESYCAHLLLSKDEIYFTIIEAKGSRRIYGPRPAAQVEEQLRRKLALEAAEKEIEEFVQLLTSAKLMPYPAKPRKSSWLTEEKIRKKIESLECYAIDACKNDEQRKLAGVILKAMGLTKTASSAVNLLIDIGYFPVHVNLDLLKLNVPTVHSDEIISAAESLLLSQSVDLDETDRKDLTDLKVYAIDVDEADELDDALSATRLLDGRIKVWIHVADPARFVRPRSLVDREAMKRGTSIFLPTATYPMFPEKLAMAGMSLKQGELCHAVTVSVVLHSDGSIAEFAVDNSIIKPTYMLTYESASELIHLSLEEEIELKILSEAATLRLQWRRQQGAIDTATLETRIKVPDPEEPEPEIKLYVEDQADPAMRLVSEMMILCGEVIASYGSQNNIPLPYRGQPQSNIDVSAFSHLPEGPVRSSALVKIMRAAEFDFRKPIRHGVLGIPGYVQFTSPIRRYMDLLAHYQLKAFLRGESLPFSSGQLEGIASSVNMNARLAKKICNTSLRYWILEFLRRQAKEKRYHALILRFIKDRIAALLLVEVGLQASAWVSVGRDIGDEIVVRVEESHPRDDFLSLREVI